MTAILLDTHVALWVLVDSPRLGAAARSLLQSRPGDVFVSVASVWEVSIKQSVGKLTAPDTLWDQAEANGLRLLDVTRADAEAVRDLPMHHRDPFDRLLIAQARRHRAEVMTVDARFADYDVGIINP